MTKEILEILQQARRILNKFNDKRGLLPIEDTLTKRYLYITGPAKSLIS
jgi:hypothetical protein